MSAAKPSPHPWKWNTVTTPADANGVDLHFIRGMPDGDLALAAPELLAACEAVLLFHDGAPWDDAKQRRWYDELKVGPDATGRSLCDFVREAIAKARGEVRHG